jgi:xanthine dehydrogenase iron-sulfur cluster and FAD-binding subunit A
MRISDLLATAGNILVCSVLIPTLLPSTVVRTYKTSMRHTFAHAIVNLGVCLTFQVGDLDTIKTGSFLLGGVCDQLLNATDVSAAVMGQKVSTTTLTAAIAALKGQIAKVGPSTDPRWTGEYRLELAAGFLYKTFLEARVGVLPAPFASAVQDMITAASRPISSGAVDFAVNKDEAPVSSWIPKIDSLIQVGPLPV